MISSAPSDVSASTMVFGDTLVYAAGGYPQKNLFVIRADGKGDIFLDDVDRQDFQVHA